MNHKKISQFMIMSILAIMLLQIGLVKQNIQAAEKGGSSKTSYEIYNEEKTKMQNKYNIEGEILKVKQYSDYTLVLSKKALYFIQNGKVKKYDLKDKELFSNTKIERMDNYIYISPYIDSSKEYKILKIDCDKLQEESYSIKDYIDLDSKCELKEVTCDKNNNKWFSVYKKDSKKYELLKYDNNSKTKAKVIASFDNNNSFHYEDVFTNIKIDNDCNAWFRITENNNEIKKYLLGKVSKYGTVQKISIDEDVNDYDIDKDGTAWIVTKSKVIHTDNAGKITKEYKISNGKDIDIDDSGTLWLLDDCNIKKFSSDKFVDVMKVSSYSKEISVVKEAKITIINTKDVTLINGNDKEEISFGSYINNQAVVLKDSSNDIRILSSNYKYSEDNKKKDELVTDTMVKDGQFKINSKTTLNFRPYNGATIYKNEIYLPIDTCVYKIVNNSLEEYINLDKDIYSERGSIELDNEGTLYIAGVYNKIYIVGLDKKIKEIDLLKGYNIEELKERMLIKDSKGKIYFLAKNAGVKAKLYELNGSECKEVNYRLGSGVEPCNIFLNEKDELEFVYKNESGYMVYKLDENNIMEKDKVFESQGENLTKTYNEINGLKKTCDDELILWIGENMLYTKESNSDNFICKYNIKADCVITSMKRGNDGRVYIGTSNSGVMCYGEDKEKNSDTSEFLPKQYENKEPIKGSENIKLDKEWKFDFNMEIDINTVNEENIYLVDTKGTKKNSDIALSQDKKSIKIIPKEKYDVNKLYYVVISDKLKSINGSTLREPVVVKFNTTKSDDKSDSNIPKEFNVKFQIIESKELENREKSFTSYIINLWKDNTENENKKISKVTIKNVSLGTSTAYVLFDAEILTNNDGKVEKKSTTIKLNSKKKDGIWQIID